MPVAEYLQTICIELESKIVCLWQSVAVSGKPRRYPLNRGRKGQGTKMMNFIAKEGPSCFAFVN